MLGDVPQQDERREPAADPDDAEQRSEIAAVADGRASENPKTTNAITMVAKMPPTIHEISPTSAPSRVRIRPT